MLLGSMGRDRRHGAFSAPCSRSPAFSYARLADSMVGAVVNQLLRGYTSDAVHAARVADNWEFGL